MKASALTSFAKESTIKTSKSKYIKKGPKPYTLWLINHKDEIMNIPSLQRTDYVHEHLNNDLELHKTKYDIYQLLYRNKMIDPRSEPKPKPEPLKKGPKEWRIWLNNHKDEILALPQKERIDYVFNHLNEDLNLDKSRYSIYQLLYRNGYVARHENNQEIEI